MTEKKTKSATPRKNWTLQTVLRELRLKVADAYGEDILNPSAGVLTETLGTVIGKLRAVQFEQSMELEGQDELFPKGTEAEPDKPQSATVTDSVTGQKTEVAV